MKELFEELKSGEPVVDVLMGHKKEAVQLVALLVAVLMGVLLYLHQSSGDLVITGDSDGSSRQTAAEDGGDPAAGASGGAGGSGDGVYGGLNGAQLLDENGQPLDTDGIVYVDIGGAVKHPMLAELPTGSRVEDAIEAAGGLKKNADMTEVNRAQILVDGEKIYIPEEGETAAGGGSGSGGGGSGSAGSGISSASGADMVGISSGRININTADVTLLQQLTGVGPVTAQKIVDYREQNGRFQSIEDIKNVSGIGDKTFEKMKDDITI